MARCARDSDWCDGVICRESGIDCPNAEPRVLERNGFPFGARDGRTLITCPLCGAWVGSRDGQVWKCDDGHVIWPTLASEPPRDEERTDNGHQRRA